MRMQAGTLLGIILCLALPVAAAAGQRAPRLDGTWRAKTPDGPQTVIVRADSSASWGDETVRWRVVADSIFIAMGDEWMVYNFKVAGRRLTLSGGDLEEPILLERVGPATSRPDSVAVPPAPPMTRRAESAPDRP
jgi:hypothetical protein